jgi:hypothetical protein
MKRIALLIANTNGLNGTKIDLERFSSFLQSLNGGAWDKSEIITLPYNPSREETLELIEKIRNNRYDYVIIMFSGHGGQKRQTIIEINGRHEKIKETELKGLSPRQLIIFDCCRVSLQQHLDENILIKSSMNFSAYDYGKIKNCIRKNYEERIMQAIPQQTILYSCSEGQCSYDTRKGAVYLNCLLNAAEKNVDSEFMTVEDAHTETVEPTYQYSLNESDGPQIPDAHLPKCLSEQQLIISINPKWYFSYG